MNNQKEQLERKAEKLAASINGWRKRIADAQAEIQSVEQKVRRLNLIELLGQPVTIQYRGSGSAAGPWIDDAVGVLEKVNRTRCLINYCPRGKWFVRLDNVIPVDEEQGQTIDNMLSEGLK